MNLDNIVILTGRLVKDPMTTYTANNIARSSFTVAVRDGKDKDGDYATQFIDCVAWRNTAEFVDQYFKKGDGISLHGKLNKRTYEKDGQKRSIVEVNVETVGFPIVKTIEKKPTPGFIDIDDDIELPY